MPPAVRSAKTQVVATMVIVGSRIAGTGLILAENAAYARRINFVFRE